MSRANNFIKSRALIILYGSQVYLVVFTDILPSIKSISPIILNFFNSFFTNGQISFIYFSRYQGNKTEKLDSSNIPLGLSSGLNSSTYHLSRVGSLSQGFSLRYLLFLFTAGYSSIFSVSDIQLVFKKFMKSTIVLHWKLSD